MAWLGFEFWLGFGVLAGLYVGRSSGWLWYYDVKDEPTVTQIPEYTSTLSWTITAPTTTPTTALITTPWGAESVTEGSDPGASATEVPVMMEEMEKEEESGLGKKDLQG